MALQFDVNLRNAILNAIETHIGTSPILRIRTGAPPASLADADTGTIIAEMTLPADWMEAAANGVKSKTGTWQDLSADASGIAGHFRIYHSGGTAIIQGTAGETADTPDMVLDNKTINAGQQVTVNTFAITAGNA